MLYSRMQAAYAATSSHSAHGPCLQSAHVNSPTSYSCMLSGTQTLLQYIANRPYNSNTVTNNRFGRPSFFDPSHDSMSHPHPTRPKIKAKLWTRPAPIHFHDCFGFKQSSSIQLISTDCPTRFKLTCEDYMTMYCAPLTPYLNCIKNLDKRMQ